VRAANSPRPPTHAHTPLTHHPARPPAPAEDHATALSTKISLDWRTGVAATDWDTIAKKEHLDQLSVEMRKVEGAIREIYAEMLQLQQREQEMRDINGGGGGAGRGEGARNAQATGAVGGGCGVRWGCWGSEDPSRTNPPCGWTRGFVMRRYSRPAAAAA
jgi:hypothetical protein